MLFRKSSAFDDTLRKHSHLAGKLKEFMAAKANDFNSRFGASDKPFSAGGNFSKAVKGLKHAHLNSDISIVYNVHGSDPRVMDLYGLFSHEELGTGQPANINRQKSKSKSFSGEKFTNL